MGIAHGDCRNYSNANLHKLELATDAKTILYDGEPIRIERAAGDFIQIACTYASIPALRRLIELWEQRAVLQVGK